MGLHINIVGRSVKAMEPHTYARGVAFTESNVSESESLLEYFARTETAEDFRVSVESLNGYFAVALKRGLTLFAAVDRARSIPLFYGSAGDEFYISDDANWVQSKVGSFERSELAEHEFCMTGYVTDSDTLYPGVKQLRAGELLLARVINRSVQVSTERYCDFIDKNDCTGDLGELSSGLDKTLIRCFERLLRLANGRTLVVPLSGGYDSRLIVLMLKRLGYKEVAAFTYGRPGNVESEISKRIANYLHIPWYFVPYSNESWWQWFRTEEREAYYEMAHQAVSLPHLQDWPAVWELRQRRLVPDDSIFVPGHTGDFISGGHIPKKFANVKRVSRNELVETIFTSHYSLAPIEGGKASIFLERLSNRITHGFDTCDYLAPETAARLCENWDWQERQAKFIVNSVRVYEFWDYDWWLPLWDSEMLHFWAGVPLEHRIGQKLYIDYIKKLTVKIIGNENASTLVTDRDERINVLKHCAKQTPFRGLTRFFYRQFKRMTEYETHPMAWYGIMPKGVFRKYYHKGYVSVNTYLAPHAIGLIDLG